MRVEILVDYIESINNTLTSGTKLRNISSGSTIPQNIVDGILQCIKVGENSYKEYKRSRLVDKSKKLHDTIANNKSIFTPKPPASDPQKPL